MAQPIEARRYILNPTYIGFFLPYLSSKGPYNNWPADIPIKKLESESITCDTDVCKVFAISGNAGRYISIEKGPMAVSRPRIRMRKNLLFELLTGIWL